MKLIIKQLTVNLFLSLALITLSVKSFGQKKNKDLGKGVIRIAGRKSNNPRDAIYGLITGQNHQDSVYFMVISTQQLGKKINIIFDQDNTKIDGNSIQTKANRVGEKGFPILINNVTYFLNVFRVHTASLFDNVFYSDKNLNKLDGFKVYRDIKRNSENSSYISKAPYVISSDGKASGIGLHTYYGQDDFFRVENGLPLVDENNMLLGIVINHDTDNSFETLDFNTIRQNLITYGNFEQNPCKYVNLLESESRQIPCETLRANISNKQKRLIANDRDYDVAVTVGGGFFENTFALKDNKIVNSPGYSYSASVYFAPDVAWPRAFISPTFNQINIETNSSYQYIQNPQFKLHSVHIQEIEFPIGLEYPFTFKSGDVYVGAGVSFGWITSSKFSFTDNDNNVRTQNIVGHTTSKGKVQIKFGTDIEMFRLGFYVNYGLDPILDKDYEIVLNSKSVKPFENANGHQFYFGVNLNYRLWGRWHNGYKVLPML